jgi:hypothetical protein
LEYVAVYQQGLQRIPVAAFGSNANLLNNNSLAWINPAEAIKDVVMSAIQVSRGVVRHHEDRAIFVTAAANDESAPRLGDRDHRESVDGLDSRIISSIELSTPNRQHLAIKEAAILVISKQSLSETLMWRARAGRARRIASMLSPRDAALVEAYARECEDCARAASIEGAGVNKRLSVGSRRRDNQTFISSARSRRPNQAA